MSSIFLKILNIKKKSIFILNKYLLSCAQQFVEYYAVPCGLSVPNRKHCEELQTQCLLYYAFDKPDVTSPNFPAVISQTRPYAAPAHTLSPFLGIFTPSQALGHSAFKQGFHLMNTKPRIQATTQPLISVQILASLPLHTTTAIYDYSQGMQKHWTIYI